MGRVRYFKMGYENSAMSGEDLMKTSKFALNSLPWWTGNKFGPFSGWKSATVACNQRQMLGGQQLTQNCHVHGEILINRRLLGCNFETNPCAASVVAGHVHWPLGPGIRCRIWTWTVVLCRDLGFFTHVNRPTPSGRNLRWLGPWVLR